MMKPPKPNTRTPQTIADIANIPSVVITARQGLRGKDPPPKRGSKVTSIIDRVERNSHDSRRKNTAMLIADQLNTSTPTTGIAWRAIVIQNRRVRAASTTSTMRGARARRGGIVGIISDGGDAAAGNAVVDARDGGRRWDRKSVHRRASSRLTS